MIPLHRLIAVELFKLRRTLALFVALVLPGVIALLYALMLAQRGKAFMGLPEQAWNALFQANLSGWVMLGLTLFVALEAALVVGVEHQHGGLETAVRRTDRRNAAVRGQDPGGVRPGPGQPGVAVVLDRRVRQLRRAGHA
jgi:hypothetical protein